MALKTSTTINVFGNSTVYNNTYARIYQVETNKPIAPSEIQQQPPANSRITVMFYSDDSAIKQLKVWHYMFDIDLSANAANPWQQAYEYLKTLPEFADATDC